MTAQTIFDMARDLMNERGDDGVYAPDVRDYRADAISAINIMIIALYELDCKIRGKKCCFDKDTPPTIKALEDEIPLKECICRGVMPYGLAFMLLLEEEPSRAETFRRLYEQESYRLDKIHTKGRRHKITEVY